MRTLILLMESSWVWRTIEAEDVRSRIGAGSFEDQPVLGIEIMNTPDIDQSQNAGHEQGDLHTTVRLACVGRGLRMGSLFLHKRLRVLGCRPELSGQSRTPWCTILS